MTGSDSVAAGREVSEKQNSYGRVMLLIAGLGGLLYGIDIGIISDALMYLDKTVDLSISQTSWIVAAVFGGGTAASLVAGILADWIGRQKMMVLSGLLFVSSVLLIISSHGFYLLFAGRLLQGASGGVIAVVVPLYLAECLSAKTRGSGSAIFQFMLTLGIVVAAFTGLYYTTHAEAAIRAANGNLVLIRAAQNHVWRGMFLSVVYPGLLFVAGSLFLSESPRWLFRKGKKDAALAALRRSQSEEAAQLQMQEMEAAALAAPAKTEGVRDSVLQRKYILPFLLACVILACNQATGINSILSYLTLILRQAGMTAAHATQGGLVVKILNMLMTIVAVALIDRRGRKFLLAVGTGGVIVALLGATYFFYGFESQRKDVRAIVAASVSGNSVSLPVAGLAREMHGETVLTVLYSYGHGDKTVTALSDDTDPTLHITPDAKETGKLEIKRATYGEVPPEKTGWWVTACLALFIAAFAVGPGVVVWLALSELMPTRIRSAGMGIALLLNQGVSTTIAGIFLPVVGHHGYAAIFTFWAACTTIYFITAVFFLPETKGRTLEEIELYFDKRSTEKA